MLSESQLLSTTVARTTSYPQDVGKSHGSSLFRSPKHGKSQGSSLSGSPKHSPNHCSPAIAVTRPSVVTALVDDTALSLLHAKYYEQSRSRSSSSMSVDGFLQANNLNNKISRSAQNSPQLQRRHSFRVKTLKLFKSPSTGMEGYEPMNTDFADEANQSSREKVTSLTRALSRNSSFSASTPTSPRPYRAMTFTPARNRVVRYDSNSSEEEEGGGDGSDGSSLVSPVSESNLDFGAGTRNRFVSFLLN